MGMNIARNSNKCAADFTPSSSVITGEFSTKFTMHWRWMLCTCLSFRMHWITNEFWMIKHCRCKSALFVYTIRKKRHICFVLIWHGCVWCVYMWVCTRAVLVCAVRVCDGVHSYRDWSRGIALAAVMRYFVGCVQIVDLRVCWTMNTNTWNHSN